MPRRPPAKFLPNPFAYHQVVELRVDDLTNMGVGVGRVEGWVVMVPYSLPGERVRARIFRNHKNYSEGDLIEVVEPSPQRVEPVCALFGQCGGCQYQNLAYPAQLEWKRRQIEALIERMAGLSFPVEPVVPSPRPYGYRTKLTPHYDKPRHGDPGPIGFLKSGQRFELVDVVQCPIATDAINAALPALREEVRRQASARRKGATLLLREGLEGVTTDSHHIVTEKVGHLTLQFEAGTFFQNNPSLLPALVQHVMHEAALDNDCEFLADAYCGCGLFALACAPSFRRVVGVEVSEKSVSAARANAALNRLDNCVFIAADAFRLFEAVNFPGSKTCVIIDPPRAGCDNDFLRQLFAFSPRRVIYVSCNPATQMRDLSRFSEAGYKLARVRPFDMFPQTRHLETVMTLEPSFAKPTDTTGHMTS